MYIHNIYIYTHIIYMIHVNLHDSNPWIPESYTTLDARYPCILDIRARARSAMCRWSPSKRLSGLTGDALDQAGKSGRSLGEFPVGIL